MGFILSAEWPFTLDIPALLASGWRPVPFQEFVVKIASRCDLSCDYCYVYEMADQSWRSQPRRMSAEVADSTARRIAEHVRTHRLREVVLTLHGGEPLLAGPGLIKGLTLATRKALDSETRLEVRIQTNAVGLDDAYLHLLGELGIHVGVSLDGGATEHDRHRKYANGQGSYAAVSSSLRRLRQPQFRHLFAGLLCTVDLRNDPIETYEGLIAFEPTRIDFLLPHGTWDSPPPGRADDASSSPYGDWLITVFDHWYRAPSTRVRLFEEIMHLLVTGVSGGSEAVGLSPARVVVIQTDGSIEQVDHLKAAYHGAATTGLHVRRDPFDAALLLPGMAARQLGELALCAKCTACPIHRVCGAGLYPHRYKKGTGFANPSVYCSDLARLIRHIRTVVQADIDSRLTEESLWNCRVTDCVATRSLPWRPGQAART